MKTWEKVIAMILVMICIVVILAVVYTILNPLQIQCIGGDDRPECKSIVKEDNDTYKQTETTPSNIFSNRLPEGSTPVVEEREHPYKQRCDEISQQARGDIYSINVPDECRDYFGLPEADNKIESDVPKETPKTTSLGEYCDNQLKENPNMLIDETYPDTCKEYFKDDIIKEQTKKACAQQKQEKDSGKVAQIADYCREYYPEEFSDNQENSDQPPVTTSTGGQVFK